MANRHPTTNVTEAEQEQLFTFWYESDRNYEATARKFKRAKTTIYRHAKKRKWVERADQIRANIAKSVDRKIEKDVVSNVRMAKACLTKEVKVYLHEDHKATGDIKAIIALMKYIDGVEGPNEIAEAIRAATRVDDVPYDPDLCEEVIDLLTEALAEQKERLDGPGD